MKDRRQVKAARAAALLATASALMIAIAMTAAFAPLPGKHPAGPSALLRAQPPFPAGLHPLNHSPTPAPSPTTPAAALAPSARTYPPPIFGAAPRTYPAPVRTYPAPTPRTYPPPAPPGSDLPAPVPLVPPLAGVVAPDVAAWDAATGSTAELAARYVSMGRPLAPSWLHSVMRVSAGAEPVIEITPTAPGQPAVSLEDIAAGTRDGWLADMRGQIIDLGRPVVISFAPEANGGWYAWGEDPAGFVAAWQHVHAVLAVAGVTWLWQVSAHNPGDTATQDFAAYWPGPAYVDWAGLDGYYYLPGNTFGLRFDQSLAEVVTFWNGPVLIAESAVSPAVGCPDGQAAASCPGYGDDAKMAAAVADLFAGVARDHLLGLVYFDLRPLCPPECGFYHPDFRLEKYPAALAAYTKAVNNPW